MHFLSGKYRGKSFTATLPNWSSTCKCRQHLQMHEAKCQRCEQKFIDVNTYSVQLENDNLSKIKSNRLNTKESHTNRHIKCLPGIMRQVLPVLPGFMLVTSIHFTVEKLFSWLHFLTSLKSVLLIPISIYFTLAFLAFLALPSKYPRNGKHRRTWSKQSYHVYVNKDFKITRFDFLIDKALM